MKVAVIGASGRAGSRIQAELVSRGHAGTGIARHPEQIATAPGVTAVKGDVFDQAGLAEILRGHDAVVSAVHFLQSDPAVLIGAVRASGVKRYVVVGGAGSLLVAPGLRLVDTPQFPAEYLAEATKGAAFLETLRTVDDLEWTFISPAALIDFGQRTGSYRKGGDQLLVDAAGNSTISFEDYAVALVDELEQPAHVRQRFTVAY
jgi:putative NADH-flavin reductase